jgi:hypothetical protein
VVGLDVEEVMRRRPAGKVGGLRRLLVSLVRNGHRLL